MSKIELTNMVMVQNPETNEVLVQKRVKSWCGISFPGGHVENGESFYDSAVREVKEETGLTVKNLKYCGTVHWHNTENDDKYYVFLDEIQLVKDFEEVLDSLLHIQNIDVYVTGSNSRFLVKDVITEFRGRGDEIRLYPLSFKEFFENRDDDFISAFTDYYTYGGLPLVTGMKTHKEKSDYLTNLFSKVYLTDVIDRYMIVSKKS